MSVTNQPATGFEAPSRSTLLRMTVVVIGLIAGAVLAVSLASRAEVPSLDAPIVEAPAGQSSQSIQAQIDRMNGIGSQYQSEALKPEQRPFAEPWRAYVEGHGTSQLLPEQRPFVEPWRAYVEGPATGELLPEQRPFAEPWRAYVEGPATGELLPEQRPFAEPWRAYVEGYGTSELAPAQDVLPDF